MTIRCMTLVKESLHQPSIYFGRTKSTWQHFLCFRERFPDRKNVFPIILTEYERTVNMEIFYIFTSTTAFILPLFINLTCEELASILGLSTRSV